MNSKDKTYYETKATEEEFLKWYKDHDWGTYEKPSLTIDNVILGLDPADGKLKILLIQRKSHPFINKYALAGGFVNPNESPKQATVRETFEETGVTIKNDRQMWQVGTFAEPNRDPRQWIVSVAHVTFLYPFVKATAGDDASTAEWYEIKRDDNYELYFKKDNITISKKDLAFDHADIIDTAFNRINDFSTVNLDILYVFGKSFTLSQALSILKLVNPRFNTMQLSNFKKIYTAKKQYVKPVLKITNKTVKSANAQGRPALLFKLNE